VGWLNPRGGCIPVVIVNAIKLYVGGRSSRYRLEAILAWAFARAELHGFKVGRDPRWARTECVWTKPSELFP
jgi:hypothetical protein